MTDLKSCLVSNVCSSFFSGCLDTDMCASSLKEVVQLSNTCLSCLVNGSRNCKYAKLDDSCAQCLASGQKCISLVVMLVLWDMGSSHKSVAQITPTINWYFIIR